MDRIMVNSSDFLRNGDLRSNVSFRFCGEISDVRIRQSQIYGSNEEEKEKEREGNFYLELLDHYGFTCSLFRPRMSREKAFAFAAKIPYGVTLLIEGKVCIRKGRTYFNAQRVLFPDETPVFLWSLEKEEEKEEEKNEALQE